ncbi:claudin-19-like isoform X1 [Bufo gargarizans]|uniref:claudin-19-like isoform X1 n=1 Tax=Bufo gargarizans TaxID=30331 RepID=UPI001CF3F945|nr:claudin-19-like isoform X1 [Bufo gargarizans]XP_044147435.1 claudin-19-like isoform X1 [Bufo gargarizans]
MNRTPYQVCAMLLAVAGMTCTIVSTVSLKWKTSSSSGTIITSTSIFEGLWGHCVGTSTGSVQCKRFSSLFSLPPHTQACRALMIISLILGLFGCIISLFGLKCTKFGSNNEHTKGKIALSGGLIFILAGLCCVVPVSWYAATITQQFYDSLYGGIKYELGPALYIGWAGSLLAIIGGSLLCCSFKAKQKTAKKPVYTYKAPDNEFTQFKEMRETSTARAYV